MDSTKRLFISTLGFFCCLSYVQAQIEDTVPVGLLQTVIISSQNNNADLYGHRYDGQARTERLLDYIPGVDLISRGGFGQSTYYVLKRPRTIDYDRGSHTLSIGLYEKELPEGAQVSSSPFDPEQVAILPDTSLQWQYLVPVWMKKIMRPPGLREVVEVVGHAPSFLLILYNSNWNKLTVALS